MCVVRSLATRLSLAEWIVITILALVLLSPFSCWRRGDDEGVTVKLWFFGLPGDAELIEKALVEYRRRRPDVRVVMSTLPGKGYLQKLLPAMQANAAGDVVFLHWSMVAEVAAKQALLSLGELVAADAYDIDDLFEGSTLPYTYDGQLYAMPFRGSTMVLFYNRDLFDAAGLRYPDDEWTREDFLAAAKRLTIREDGRVVQIGCMPDEPTSWVYSAGGTYASDDLSELRFTDPRTLDGLRFYVELRTRHGVTASNMDADGADPTAVNVFEAGNVAMLISGPWELGTFAHIDDFRWDVALFPKGPAGRHTRYAGVGFGVWSGTKVPGEAWELVKFLCGRDAGRVFRNAPTDVPARRSVAESPEFLKPDEYVWDMGAFLRAMNPQHTTLRTFPRSNRWMEVRRHLTSKLDEVLINGRDLGEAMAELEDEVAALLAN